MPATYTPSVGMIGTTSGFVAKIVRVCEWSRQADGSVMIEVRTLGNSGVSCISHEDFIPASTLRTEKCPVCLNTERLTARELSAGLQCRSCDNVDAAGY